MRKFLAGLAALFIAGSASANGPTYQFDLLPDTAFPGYSSSLYEAQGAVSNLTPCGNQTCGDLWVSSLDLYLSGSFTALSFGPQRPATFTGTATELRIFPIYIVAPTGFGPGTGYTSAQFTAVDGIYSYSFDTYYILNGVRIPGSYGVSTGRVSFYDTYVAQPVPEPETYVLMLAGLVAVGAVVRRRSKAAA